MPRFIFSISQDRFETLQGLSCRTGLPMAEIARQAIGRYLDSQMPCTVVVSGAILSGFVMIFGGK